jgi:hypothetical protein
MEKVKQVISVFRSDGIMFTSATRFCQEQGLNTKVRKTIVAQPGYRTGQEMCIAKAQTGNYRLYVRVSGQWMDASLQDLAW